MDDMPVRQVVGGADHRLARTDGRQSPALLCQTGACGTVNGTGHTTAGQKFGIGRIHDDIDIRLCGNIAFDALNFHSRHDSSLPAFGVKR
jgi:hypothetical protein